jgi:flagellin-specific chaperone FliS
MKLSFHIGKADAGGRHNDRNFDISKAPHINPELVKENRYYTYNDRTDLSFRQVELEFYRQTYGNHLAKQNARYRKAGQKARIKTIQDYYSSIRTRPQDLIIQIGNREENVGGDKLWDCALEYARQFDEKYGDYCKILTMALHKDEETPHVHIRRAWVGRDAAGDREPSMRRAFEEMKIPPIDRDSKESRSNTRQMTFTKEERDTFREICKERQIELEPEPEIGRKSRKHMETPEYKEYAKELESLQRSIETRQTELQEISLSTEKATSELDASIKDLEKYLSSDLFDGRYEREIESAKERSRAERLRRLMDAFKQAQKEEQTPRSKEQELREALERHYDKKIRVLEERNATLTRRSTAYRSFIIDKGLSEDFNREYHRQKEVEHSEKDHEREIPSTN